MEKERNVEIGINKDFVNSSLMYTYSRMTTQGYVELMTSPECAHRTTKIALMVIQAAKFAQQLDYHRCYAIILDIEGMDQHTNYKDLKDSLTVLKKVYATQK